MPAKTASKARLVAIVIGVGFILFGLFLASRAVELGGKSDDDFAFAQQQQAAAEALLPRGAANVPEADQAEFRAALQGAASASESAARRGDMATHCWLMAGGSLIAGLLAFAIARRR